MNHPLLVCIWEILKYEAVPITWANVGGLGSNMNVGQVFGIADGTVTLYTRRVLLALMELWEEVVKWPSIEQRAAMKVRMLEDPGSGWSLFRNCVGLVDGTLVPIKCRPYQKERAAEFWNFRKAKYACHLTI